MRTDQNLAGTEGDSAAFSRRQQKAMDFVRPQQLSKEQLDFLIEVLSRE